jgi:hypothetical protein
MKSLRSFRCVSRKRGVHSILSLVMCAAFGLSPGCFAADSPSQANPSQIPSYVDAGSAMAPHWWNFSGTIVARPASGSLMIYSGDNPEFSIFVPGNASRLLGRLVWSPSGEPMGLEFHHPGKCFVDPNRVASWSSPAQNISPPVVVSILHPETGLWCGYVGPGVAGAAVVWNLSVVVR